MREIITARMPVSGQPALLTVLFEDGKPAEVYAESGAGASDLGWIYLGKAESSDPRLQAAFIRIGKDRRVYLPLSSAPEGLKPGMEFPVQIVQESQKTKLPKGSAAFEIAGEYMVLTHATHGASYSRKLSAASRKRLQDFAEARQEDPVHILFRTKAEEAGSDVLENEYREISGKLEEILQKAASRTCYTLLYKAPGLQEQLIRRYGGSGLERFVTDDPDVWKTLKEAGDLPLSRLEFYEDPAVSLFRLRNFSTILERALSREIHLRSGGSLIIEQTEAFTAIDVNSSRFSGKRDSSEARMAVNREAAEEAARQIRLRQLSGTILIDFINPDTVREERELSEILSAAFLQDPVQTKCVDFTKLHICEITRRKRNRSLQEQIRLIGEKHGQTDPL